MIRAICMALCLPCAALAQVAPPEGYRMDEYRAPVPDSVPGGTVVDAQRAFDLWDSGEVAFIDVLPQAPRPAGLPKGTIWRDKPRESIPGAMWLPNTGYGALADVMRTYFDDGLAEATGGDRTHPVLFFCLSDCWMSWNAARRAAEDGYTQVYWFPEGTDGWAEDLRDLERVTPRPGHP